MGSVAGTSYWADYNDTATALTPIEMSAGVPVRLTCDALGAQTTEAFSPGLALWDAAINEFTFADVDVGAQCEIRATYTVTPTLNNASLTADLQFNAFGGFSLTQGLADLSDGAGIMYQREVVFSFYIGSPQVRDEGAYMELTCGSDAQLVVSGFYVGVKK